MENLIDFVLTYLAVCIIMLPVVVGCIILKYLAKKGKMHNKIAQFIMIGEEEN